MNLLLLLIGGSTFCLVICLLDLVFQPFSGHAWRQVRKVQLLDLTDEAKELVEQPLVYRLSRPIYELIKARVKLSPIAAQSLQVKLEQAGLAYQPDQFKAFKLIVGLGCFLFGMLVVLVQPSTTSFMKWIALSISVYFLPDIYLRGQIIKRRELIMEEFPDFIDATRSYLSSGLSIYQTIKHVKEISGPGLSTILEKLSAELEVYDQITALRKFAFRAGLLEVQNFVVTLEQGISAGIPLKEIFLSQSQLMRELRKLSLKRKIKQKPTYMALVGGLLFINIFIIIGLPAVLTIMSMRGLGD